MPTLTRHTSRSDDYFGNNHVFNKTIFDASRAYWTADTITAQMLANSKLARQIESRASNPTYTFTSDTEEFSIGEVASPIIVFGDSEQGTVERDLVEYFFGEFFGVLLSDSGFVYVCVCVCVWRER